MANEWNGDTKNKPQKNQVFTFKGQTYKWQDCPCGCGHAHATDTTGERFSFEMTTRLRGENQGHPLANVLLKLVGMEKLVETNGDGDAAMELLYRTLSEIKANSGNNRGKSWAYLRSKGVSPEELNEVLDSTDLVQVVVISLDDDDDGPWTKNNQVM